MRWGLLFLLLLIGCAKEPAVYNLKVGQCDDELFFTDSDAASAAWTTNDEYVSWREGYNFDGFFYKFVTCTPLAGCWYGSEAAIINDNCSVYYLELRED